MNSVLKKVSMFGLFLLVAIVPGAVCLAVNNNWCTSRLPADPKGRASYCTGYTCATQVNFCPGPIQEVAIEVVELTYPVCEIKSGFNCTTLMATTACTNIRHYSTLPNCAAGITACADTHVNVPNCSTP
jgi:hypothetical protein